MAMQVREVKEWLDTLDDTEMIAIDDGGLTLQTLTEPLTYIEIGGIPEEEESENHEALAGEED